MEKSFEVVSGTLVCSDPFYSIPTWCQGIVENVKNGTWVADVERSDKGDWGNRISVLEVRHIDNTNPDFDFNEHLPFTGGVDSGQFGFFDKAFYRNDESAKDLEKYGFSSDFDKEDGDVWYRACCQKTLGDESWGVLPNGVVSTSGFGDGSYDVFEQKNAEGEVIALCVVYIWEDELDEDEDWEEQEEE
jgi:hypothetical protein